MLQTMRFKSIHSLMNKIGLSVSMCVHNEMRIRGTNVKRAVPGQLALRAWAWLVLLALEPAR